MNDQTNQERIRRLYQMLFEMATGNLSFRLAKTEQDDALDELADVLNTFAGAMRTAIIEGGNIIPHYSYQSLVQTTFVLDNDYTISNLSSNAFTMLGYSPEMLFKIPFLEILADSNKPLWEKIAIDATLDSNYHLTIQLIFKTASRQLLPTFCTISRLVYSNKLFVSSVTTVLQDVYAEQFGIKSNIAARPTDSAIVQNVYDYILQHLEDPMPTVRELSRMFGTNEFRIKDGFKHFFNTSVYQFYNEERLKKAHLLVQQSDVPLKVIAYTCGYNDYTNFYKAFKKRFGYPPSDLQRGLKTMDDEQ